MTSKTVLRVSNCVKPSKITTLSFWLDYYKVYWLKDLAYENLDYKLIAKKINVGVILLSLF